MRVRVLVKAFFAMEHQKVHAERIESRHKNTHQHGEVGKPSARNVRGMHCLNDAVFGIKTGKQWRADQGQGTQQRCNPGDGHVLAQATHPADVLVVVTTHDDRTGTKEQKCLEERVGH